MVFSFFFPMRAGEESFSAQGQNAAELRKKLRPTEPWERTFSKSTPNAAKCTIAVSRKKD